MKAYAFARTHVGLKRKNNEDNFNLCGIIREDPAMLQCAESGMHSCSQGLYAVCDGMGGEENGEIASLLAVASLVPATSETFSAVAESTVQNINQIICDKAKALGKARMGSTLAALYVDGEQVCAANIGDSRIYLFRDGHLRQLSEDHSGAQRLVNMGILTPEQARTHPDRHKLTQYLGIDPEEMIVEPYICTITPVGNYDIFLLCSDGLTDSATDAQIADCLSTEKQPEQMTEALINLALEAGGEDNITAMVVKIVDSQSEPIWDRLYNI